MWLLTHRPYVDIGAQHLLPYPYWWFKNLRGPTDPPEPTHYGFALLVPPWKGPGVVCVAVPMPVFVALFGAWPAQA